MADPVTIGLLATTVISTGISAAGAIGQGQATAASNKFQAQVAENNRIIADQNARYSVSAGQTRAQTEDLKTGAIVGAETAAQGASGLDLTTGSPVSVREGTRQMGRLSSLNIINNSNLTAYGYKTQAGNFGAQSQLDLASAANASAAGFLNAGSSLVGGASSFASKWQSYQLRGLLPGGNSGSDVGDSIA
jgi:hypothetical protein